MQRIITIATVLSGCLLGATGARAQEALARPDWVERPDYVLIAPERFDADEVGGMFVELPNRPLRAGETRPRGPAMMFPPRKRHAATGGAQAPDQFRLTPFGPVSSNLQRPPKSNAAAAPQARASRRQPLGW